MEQKKRNCAQTFPFAVLSLIDGVITLLLTGEFLLFVITGSSIFPVFTRSFSVPSGYHGVRSANSRESVV